MSVFGVRKEFSDINTPKMPISASAVVQFCVHINMSVDAKEILISGWHITVLAWFLPL